MIFPIAANLSRALTARYQPNLQNNSFSDFDKKGVIRMACIHHVEETGNSTPILLEYALRLFPYPRQALALECG